MSLLSRQELFDRLSTNVCDVHFTKVNGEKRIMRCTVDPQRIASPLDIQKHFENEHLFELQSEGRFNVWDLDKQGWRSFLIENVTTVITPSLSEVDATIS